MAILNNSNAISAGGYDVNNSLRFRGSASAYLNRTPASAGNRQIFTYSGWVKRGTLGTVQTILSVGVVTASNPRVDWQFNASNNLEIDMNSSGTSWDCLLTTTQVFRDPSAWYHIVVAVDTTQATSSNRVKVYINGSQVTAFSTATYPSQNTNMPINNTLQHGISNYIVGSSQYFDGYLAETHLIDGSAKAASDFGETDATTGVWKPKPYSGTYGTNGFYLKFSDIATTSGSNAGLGKDFSGNTNYWTTNNISVTSGTTYDAMTDVPTNTSATVANYAVLNPLSGTATLSSANLQTTSSSGWQSRPATIIPNSGKFYAECVIGNSLSSGSYYNEFGVLLSSDVPVASTTYISSVSNGYSVQVKPSSADYWTNNTLTTSLSGTYTNGSVMQIAIDIDAGKCWLGCDNGWIGGGSPSAGTTPTFTFTANLFALLGCSNYTSTGINSANFGQRPFSYTPPTGFVRLNTFNLPTPTILQGNKYMDATLYTGTGTTQVVVNQGQFKPDFAWLKIRSASSNHVLINSVTGVTAYLNSNTTNAELTSSDQFTSFNSNGFTLGANTTGGNTNTNGSTYVGWQWQAGQGSTSSNTSGSITSTVSVNTTAGFSVVTYTTPSSGDFTVGHGLGVTPSLIITKARSTTSNWVVWSKTFSNLTKNYLLLDSTAATTLSATNIWGSAAPTSSLIGFTANGAAIANATQVAYCWAEIAGFSKFGSYTGNGSADGPFVYTGFRPAFVICKCSSSDQAGNAAWRMYDDARNPSNVVNAELYADLSNAEATDTRMDFTSNGFKIRATTTGINGSGATYIFMAFAESPFKNSLAR